MNWMDCLDELDGLPSWTGWIALMNWMDCLNELEGLPSWTRWIALMEVDCLVGLDAVPGCL